MTEQQSTQMIGQYYQQMSDFNIMKMRLDTQPLLDQIELFLRGSRFTVEPDADGKLKVKQLQMGVPKANNEGIQSMLSWISSVINPHVVQGNFPIDKHGQSEKYDMFIQEFQINLGNYVVLNCYKWQVDEDEIEGIIDFIMNLVMPFMSRCIGNQERKSYAKTMESKETNIIGGKIPTFKT